MAFYTGSVNTIADLISALTTACVAEGWMLSGNVLSKGTCYARVQESSGRVEILGGTGVDGSNAITGAGPSSAYISKQWSGDTLTFPVTYALHILTAPDEIYLLINYEVSRWQWLAFGSSPVAGLPGTGNWYGGSFAYGGTGISSGAYLTGGSGGANNSNANCPGLFWGTAVIGNVKGSYVHHGLDAGAWSGNNWGNSIGGSANAINYNGILLASLPNAWNGEIALLPIQPLVGRSSGLYSVVTDIAHARYARIDNYEPGDIITLGTDRWRVYPWWVKNAAARDGGDGVPHTGTLGWAIRYDGP